LTPVQSLLSVNCFMYWYQYFYAGGNSPLQFLQSFALHFSFPIVTELSFTRASKSLYQNIPVIAVYGNGWGTHMLVAVINMALENLSKHDGDGRRERHKTKGLIRKTMTVHVRYRFWYISLPSSAKQRREMTKFKVLCRTWPTVNFLDLNCNAVLTESAPGLFGLIRQIERVETIAKKLEIFGSHF